MTTGPETRASTATLAVDMADPARCVMTLGGDWLLGSPLPDLSRELEALNLDNSRPVAGESDTATETKGAERDSSAAAVTLAFDTGALGEWDTGLLTELVSVHKLAAHAGLDLDTEGLPEGARRLLQLAFTVAAKEDAQRRSGQQGFLAHLGEGALNVWKSSRDLLEFFGLLIQSFSRIFRGTGTCFRQDVFLQIQQAGIEALPIVSIISLLIGMIFAFVGVMQLNNFGAGIYTADLVAVAMFREIAAIITAIIMAGRTGAAYAAEIGTMKVNEEVDALTTLGFNPIDYLVSPRVIALVTMMPLLTLYSSLMGIVGGSLVGLSMLDVTLIQYTEQTISSVSFNYLFGGLFKAVVYGALVAIAGCMQGMACGNSAMAVGVATTKAVVMGIVLIVVSASILTVIYINLGI